MALTLLDFQKLVTEPKRAGIVETLYVEEPIFQWLPFEVINGLSYGYDKEAALPSVAFRGLNASYTASAGVIQPDVEHLKVFGGESDCDVALVKAYGMAQRAKYDSMFTKAMAVKFVTQMLYGNSPVGYTGTAGRAGAAYDDAMGFDGLMARITAAQTVDALGTTSAVGSSVFALRFGDGYFTGLATPEMVDYHDFGMISASPVYRARIEMIATICIENGKSVAMIKDLTVACPLLYTMMDNVRDLIVGKPSVYIMSKRSLRQLKASCLGVTAALDVTLDKLGNPMESYGGVPIITSDAMIDTEVNT
jgi:hypothetical protein